MTNALCIVAHPDDETIWMGGTIQKNKDWNWTILSLCRANDKDRAPKFRKVCKSYGAKAIISDLDDETDAPLSSPLIQDKILKNLKTKSYDYIFTHGENGEYGHRRHKEIHKAVKSLVKNKILECEKLYFFDYVSGKEKSAHDNETIVPVPNKKSDLVIELTEKQHKQKLDLVTNIYGFVHPIIETQACSKTEAFASL